MEQGKNFERLFHRALESREGKQEGGERKLRTVPERRSERLQNTCRTVEADGRRSAGTATLTTRAEVRMLARHQATHRL